MATKGKKIIPNAELQKALKGFAPVFGSVEDHNIIDRLGRLSKLLGQVDNEALRSNGMPTGKMREILSLEQSLIKEITNRKMDF